MKEKKKKSHKDSKKSKRKKEKKSKKEKKKLEKKLKKQSKALEKIAHKSTVTQTVVNVVKEAIEILPSDDAFCGPSIDLMNRAKCPETKEQWEHRQSQIRRVVDPETGRTRLIKGDGEILEEIVTRDRHKQINHEATRNDGHSFQINTVGPSATRYK